MENSQIKSLLSQSFDDGAEIIVEGDGYHYQVVVVSNTFEGVTKVKRMQMIYQVLNDHIQSGALHALSIKPFTPTEWEQQHG